MWYLLCALLGVIVGFILSFMRKRKSADPPVGLLVFDDAVSRELPYLALEQSSDLDVIRSKKYVTLKVCSVDDYSQK
jgi:hypothetical protein